MGSKRTVVSAPGKVLLAGGYLILEQENEGFVLTLSARMVCIVEDRERNGESAEIQVCCKQFRQPDYFFRVIFGENEEVLEIQEVDGIHNSYIHYALIYALFYCNPFRMKNLYITVLADNDYYSQSGPRSGLCKYRKFEFPVEMSHKTGIGSSSALMTSMIAALVVHLSDGKFDIQQTQNKWIVHNLSQVAHCSVQEKIGSGFDIAAACFGSCLYRRFDPAIIDSVGEYTSPQFKKQLTKVVESLWDISIEELNFPPGLGVVLVDRNKGTSTSNMARSVMAWKNKDTEANVIWEELKKTNNSFYRTLSEMTNASHQFVSDYYEVLKISGQASWDKDKMKFEDKIKQFIYDILYNLYSQLKLIREQLKIIGAKSNVPIEPPSQTLLLDKCSKIPGVLGVGIPGAGGYDAIFCIIIRESNAEKDISSIELDDIDLSILLSKEDHSGLKVENIHEFDFFLD